uniref:RNA-dependent RNA polymerase n=1 Tax=Bovine picobirnavirus TaxID=1977295 RepID=A0A4Y1KD88_9VIRU|nr:RNA-dependent RNA polymerase [Bovine picobirnavirus]
MPKNNETSFDKCFNLPNPGLRSYFDIVRKGQPDEYRTTFAKGSSVQSVLDDWRSTLESITDKWPTLVDFENDLRSKVGPMSVMKPLEERLEDIDHYYDDIKLESTPISVTAIKAVVAEFNAVRGLRIRDQMRTVDLMKKSTNSGSPYFTKRKVVTKKTIPCLMKVTDDQVLQYLDTRDMTVSPWNACAVLGWRGQEGGPNKEDVKQRVVWMFPYAVNIAELQVYQPLIEGCQRFSLVPAWVSMESVDLRVTRMFDTKGVDDVVICTDFSKFDQHFNADMQLCASTILSAILSPGRKEKDWLEEVFPIKYMIPLAYDYGKIRSGRHGMGSGSGGTNADETIAHRALQYEAAISNHQRLNPNSQCLGDDGVLTYPGITVEDVMRSYTAHGLEMNDSKQYVSKQDCVYLRRWHHKDYRIGGVCVGVYSTYRALGRLMEQERYYDPDVWSATMVALRQLSIIENVKYHPLREQFADFCMKRDKYRLGIDIPGFLDNVSSIAKESMDLMPDFLGYTKSMVQDQTGLDSWWIVNYLKSKR